MKTIVVRSRSGVFCGAVAALVLGVAACGGKAPAGVAAPAPKAASDLPFDAEAVRAALAASPGTPCSGADGETLADVFRQQSEALGVVDVSFDCRAGATDGRWDCTWSTFSRPSGVADPDDPCAESGGTSGYQIMTEVTSDGALVPDTVHCIAPG